MAYEQGCGGSSEDGNESSRESDHEPGQEPGQESGHEPEAGGEIMSAETFRTLAPGDMFFAGIPLPGISQETITWLVQERDDDSVVVDGYWHDVHLGIFRLLSIADDIIFEEL